MTKKQAEESEKHLRPGDILLSHRRYELTNALIPGYWKHASIYVGRGQVVEAVGRGVVLELFEEFCCTKDDVVVLQARFLDEVQGGLVAGFARSLVGKPYDYLVEHHQSRAVNLAFYCSEVIWWSIDQVLLAAGHKSPFAPRKTLGVPTVTPQDYYDATEKFLEITRLKGGK